MLSKNLEYAASTVIFWFKVPITSDFKFTKSADSWDNENNQERMWRSGRKSLSVMVSWVQPEDQTNVSQSDLRLIIALQFICTIQQGLITYTSLFWLSSQVVSTTSRTDWPAVDLLNDQESGCLNPFSFKRTSSEKIISVIIGVKPCQHNFSFNQINTSYRPSLRLHAAPPGSPTVFQCEYQGQKLVNLQLFISFFSFYFFLWSYRRSTYGSDRVGMSLFDLNKLEPVFVLALHHQLCCRDSENTSLAKQHTSGQVEWSSYSFPNKEINLSATEKVSTWISCWPQLSTNLRLPHRSSGDLVSWFSVQFTSVLHFAVIRLISWSLIPAVQIPGGNII